MAMTMPPAVQSLNYVIVRLTLTGWRGDTLPEIAVRVNATQMQRDKRERAILAGVWPGITWWV